MANRFLSNITINDAYTFPSADGTNGQVITTDGSGNLSFSDIQVTGAESNFVYYDVKNSSGATINKGAAVMAVGTDGNSGHILIDEMVADGSIEPKFFMGVLESTLANGEIGRVIHFGELDQLNTSTFQDGDVLWCDPATPGGFTTTEPLGPNLKLAAAIVINASTNGKIKIRVQGNAGLHELHDVKITSQANGDLLQWNNTTSVWENKTLASIADSRYVNVSGDTMTGTLYLENLLRLTGTTSGTSQIDLPPTYGALRWYDGSTFKGGIGAESWSGLGSGNDLGLYLETGTNFHIGAQAAEFVTFDSANQRVGIGTDTPNQKLDVDGNIKIGHWATAGSRYIGFGRLDNGAFGTAGASGMEIESGNFGGSGNYDQKLHFWTHTYNGGSYRRLTIDNNGRVGIGAESPSYTLQVQGTGYYNGTLYVNGNTTINAQLQVDEPAYFLGGSTSTAAVYVKSGGNSWSEGLVIHPATDNGWNGVYFSTSATIGTQTGAWFVGNSGQSGYLNDFYILNKGFASGGSLGNNNAMLRLFHSDGSLHTLSHTVNGNLSVSGHTGVGTFYSSRISTDSFIGISGDKSGFNLHGSGLGQAIYGGTSLSNTGGIFDAVRYKPATLWGYNGTAWVDLGNCNDILRGYGAHKWGGKALPNGYDEFVIYFGDIGYNFISSTVIQHSTNGHTMAVYVETKESVTNPYESGFTIRQQNTATSSWPGGNILSGDFGIGAGFDNILRIRIVPSWNPNFPGNNIDLGRISMFASYGNPSVPYQTLFDKSVIFNEHIFAKYFSDIDDTAYFVDPNSGSTLKSLQLGTAASDTTNLRLDVQGNMAVRDSNRLYFGVSSNNYNSWTTALQASGSQQQFHAGSFVFDNVGYGTDTFLTLDTSAVNVYKSIIQNRDPEWYMYGFGARGASAGQYGIGLTSDINNRTLSIHVPDQAAYGSTGNIPKISFYSNNATELFSVTSASGDAYLKGTLNPWRISFDGGATTTNQGRGIFWTGFDKEGVTDYTDTAHIRHTAGTGGHAGSVLEIASQNDADDGIAFTTNASSQLRHNGHVVWDAGNDGAGSGLDADLLDGQHGSYYINTSNIGSQSVDFATTAAFMRSFDTRNDSSTPETYNATSGIHFDFKLNSTNGLSDGGSYNGVMYWRKYGGSSDWTGGGAKEIAYTDNGNLWHRYGTGTTWGTWRKVLDSSNYGDYALPLSGGVVNSSGNYPLQLLSTQRYGIQVRNTSNTINANYGWWWFMDTNFTMGFHADASGDKMSLSQAGNLTTAGNVYAPAFYDSADTAYYVNPNDWSNLYNLNLGGAKHTYLTINPGNGYEAMVRYIGGSGSSFYVGKRTSTQLIGSTDAYHVYSETTGQTVGGYDSSGNHYAVGSSRSPIFYDLNNTSYYADPAGFSNFSSLNVGGRTVRTRYGTQQSTITSAGWHTIATYGNGRCEDELIISDADSSKHNFVRAKITWSFGNGGIQVVQSGRHGISTIRAMRLLYNTSNQTYGGVKVQVYCENPNWTMAVQSCHDGANGWGSLSLQTAVNEGAPSGWGLYNRETWGVNDQGTSSANYLNVQNGINGADIIGRPTAYWGQSGASTGMVVVEFPGGSGNYGMIHAVIDIYEYSGDNGCSVIVSGHNWNGGWYNYGAQLIGNTNKQVRVGFRGGKYCILIGDVSDSWSYGQVVLRKIQNGSYYIRQMDVHKDYNVFQTTSLSTTWLSGDLRKLSVTGNIIAKDFDFIATNGSLISQTYSKPAILLNASGTGSSGSAIGMQQVTGEGWTGIFVDFEPYTGWGLYHDNPNNYFCVTSEVSTGSLRSFTVPSRASGNRTAYEKIRFDQNNGNIISGGTVYAQSAIGANRYISYGNDFVFRTGVNTGTSVHINLADTTSDPSVATGTGISWGQRNDGQPYYIVRTVLDNYNGNYTKLNLNWHTGINIGANPTYGGVRFYSDAFGISSTVVASIASGDNNMRSNYDIIAYASDKRLKTNVEPITNAVDKVKSLTGMTYNWNEVGNDYGWEAPKERESGVFAQDVQAVLPEAVRLAPFDHSVDEDGNPVSKSGKDFLTVKYEKLVPLLIEAIKEQQEQIEELKTLINTLKK